MTNKYTACRGSRDPRLRAHIASGKTDAKKALLCEGVPHGTLFHGELNFDSTQSAQGSRLDKGGGVWLVKNYHR